MNDTHRRSLEALKRRGRLRTLAPQRGADFSSNDYLGLAQSAQLREAASHALARGVPLGTGGSRLLRGNHPELEALEEKACHWLGARAALFLGGGFSANTALFSTLPQRGDLIVHDALIHASVYDGMNASRADHAAFAHNDANAADDAIGNWRKAGGRGRPWIAVESLYSMDGDTAPLMDLLAVAERHDGMLVIDEAHATGVLGSDGRGLAAPLEGRDDIVVLHTCGKALGVMGAIVTMAPTLRDYMVNRARPFIYATAPSPLVAATVSAALDIIITQPQLRARHAALVSYFADQLRHTTNVTPTGTHIQPIVVGHDERATTLARRMQEAGFDIRAVRPPTVPEGTARLRLSLTLNVTASDVDSMLAILSPALAGDTA